MRAGRTRGRPAAAGVVLAAAVCGVVYIAQDGPDTPQEACVERLTENRDVAITGPATDEQIEEFCRSFLR